MRTSKSIPITHSLNQPREIVPDTQGNIILKKNMADVMDTAAGGMREANEN